MLAQMTREISALRRMLRALRSLGNTPVHANADGPIILRSKARTQPVKPPTLVLENPVRLPIQEMLARMEAAPQRIVFGPNNVPHLVT
ncbi:hypothetical protein DDZ14_02165 [Maritimibacter sp. 55A14]|nr:hypothetical protein DDZ14_02165 [Maritimibacter sp. 55A14]